MAKISDDAIVTGPEIAKLLGVTPTTVSKLGGDGVLVRCGRGRYRLGPSIRGYCESHRKASSHRASPASVARAKLLTVQAQRAQFAMERETGGWVREADVCADVNEAFRFARDGMLRIPARMAQDSPHLLRTDITRLEDSARAVLTELGAAGETIVKEIEDAKQQHGERHTAGVPEATQARRRLRR
jgi:phage terminase Nu1 subunit (DNA packaging protein)